MKSKIVRPLFSNPKSFGQFCEIRNRSPDFFKSDFRSRILQVRTDWLGTVMINRLCSIGLHISALLIVAVHWYRLTVKSSLNSLKSSRNGYGANCLSRLNETNRNDTKKGSINKYTTLIGFELLY